VNILNFGRFEQSFSFHMIRDFSLLLLLVATAELGIRYASMAYEFRNSEQVRIDRSAQQLADDIRSIMLNSGGPTAARTVYPILDRNYKELGLEIAVIPSSVTAESIQQQFKFTPLGLSTNWKVGEHIQASKTLSAEQLCLGCHVKAKVGDTLGTVVVRSYLEPKQEAWLGQVMGMASAMSVKIIIHTILLFLLLRIRMEPMLSLRSTTAALAKGVMDLSPRARVNSSDEFGELAADLNHFLDRVSLVVHDLNNILGTVVSVSEKLSILNRLLEQQLDSIRESASQTGKEWTEGNLQSQTIAAKEAGIFETLIHTLDELIATKLDGTAEAVQLRSKINMLKASFESVTEIITRIPASKSGSRSVDDQYLTLSQSLREMALLEGTMQKIAESGKELVQRLQDKSNLPKIT
jgi:methyl-accepting chemotaxis protein